MNRHSYLLTGCMRKDGDHFQVLAPLFGLNTQTSLPVSSKIGLFLTLPFVTWTAYLAVQEAMEEKLKPKKIIINYNKATQVLIIKKFLI